jgi:hypothetical protein
MTKLTLIAAACAALLAGGNAAEAKDKTNDQLCARYNLVHSSAVRAELVRRGALTAEEWAAVDAEKVIVGMSTAAVRCARGNPYIEHKETEAGPLEVWQYAPFKHHETLTIRDGRVVEVYVIGAAASGPDR